MDEFFKSLAIILTFLGSLRTVHSLAPGIMEYNPLKSRGYEAKSNWKEHYPSKEVSAVVAEFTSTDKNSYCSRVVLFTAKGCKLKFLKVPCNTFRLTLGLVYVDDVLWFYGMAMAKRVTEKGDKQHTTSAKYQVVIVTEFDKSTCRKTIIDEKDLSLDPTKDVKYVLDETVKGEGPAADEDCKELIQLNIPPMILLSSQEGAKVRDAHKFGPSSFFNPKELVGAETKTFTDGMVCFRIVRFYSKGRPLNAIRTTCGPLQGILMSEKTFHYGRTVMVTVDDKDPDVFTMIMNRSNGGLSRSRADAKGPPYCEKRNFKLVKSGGSYNIKLVSVVTEFELSAECKDLVDGNLQDTEEIYKLADANVDLDVYKKLEGYTKASKPSDVNLSTDLGAVTYFYKKGEAMLKAVFIVSKGVVLTAAVLGTETHTRTLTIKDGVLTHDKDLLARREPNGEVTVIIRDTPNSCSKMTFVVKEVKGRYVKEGKKSEITSDHYNDCKYLLQDETDDSPRPAKGQQ